MHVALQSPHKKTLNVAARVYFWKPSVCLRNMADIYIVIVSRSEFFTLRQPFSAVDTV